MTKLRRGIVAIAASAMVSGLLAVITPVGASAAAAPSDGSRSEQAAPSCWAIKQANPAATDGVYWLQTPTLVAPQQFYCDMTTDGGGWVLVGRGRNNWLWSDAGQGSVATLRNTPSGTGAFAPAALPSATIDGLLDGGRVDALPDGVRIVRSTNAAGTTSQDMRIALSNRQSWSWAIGGGELFGKISVGASTWGAGNTQNWGVDSQFLRLTTNELKAHNYQKGFSFGSQVAGSNSATSYLWTYTTENAALPFTQVWLRPKITSVSYPTIPAAGPAASTITPLMSTTTSPTPWGVTGVVGLTTPSELDLEVEAMTYIGRTMYVGGKFQYVQQGASGTKIAQSYLAAFNVDTGEWVSSFRPTLNGTVWDLQALPNGNLLVGGEFTSANGAANTTALAELDPTTGANVAGWKSHVAYVSSTGEAAQVKAIDVQGQWAYLGGKFNRIYNGTTAITDGRVARVKVTDGTPDGTWKPNVDGSVVELDASAQGDRVYLAGYFSHINGTSSPNEGAVSTAAGAPFVTGLSPWVPSIGSVARYQQAVKEYGDYVWLGGSEHILSQYDRATFTRQHSVITKDGGDFQAITEIDGVIYAGCHCGNYAYQDTYNYSSPIPNATDVHNVRYIVAVNATTGQLEPDFWINALDTRHGYGAWELQPDPNGCLWFGGDFTRGSFVNGAYQWLGGFGKVCPRDTVAPSVPQNVATTNVAGGVKLSWTASTDNSGTAPHYEILRGDRVIATVNGTSYTDTTGQLPATYWVRAVDALGNRSGTTAGKTVQAADTAAPAVAIMSPSAGSNAYGPTSVTADASDTGSGVASVKLTVDGTVVGTATSAPYSFTWNAAAQGTHTLQAVATDAAGNQAASAPVTVTVPPDTTKPSAPGGLTASNLTTTSAQLSWSAASDDRGVTGYQVVRDGTVVATPTTTSATDSGLAPGSTHSYVVRAVDAAGNVSNDSGAVSVTTPAALYSDSFPGADGAAWPSAWTTTVGNATTTIQSGAGALQTNDVAGAYARAQLTGLAARSGSDLLMSYRWNAATAVSYLTASLRGSGGWANAYRPKNGYSVELQSNSGALVVQKTVAGTATTLATVAGAQQVSTAKHWLRLRVVGSTIQAKVWTDGQPEPAAWTASVTDSSVTAAGQLFLTLVRGTSNVGAKSVSVDDLVVGDGS